MLKPDLVRTFAAAARSPDRDLARPALILAALEYPQLDPDVYISRLDAMGEAVGPRVAAAPATPLGAVAALNRYLFDELGFVGNRDQYEDPRNSFLNEVLDRRTGIPITLAVLYIEVARRAGVAVEGINFPGHFLLRCREPRMLPGGAPAGDLVIDPFHGGALLSERDCRQLLERHIGEEVAFDPAFLAPASKIQILTRMLLNLKRAYVNMRSFPQARDVTELLVAIDPSALTELRDRGLLAYHLRDFSSALRDLETYLRLAASAGEEDKDEQRQLWEHVKALRRRVAGFN